MLTTTVFLTALRGTVTGRKIEADYLREAEKLARLESELAAIVAQRIEQTPSLRKEIDAAFSDCESALRDLADARQRLATANRKASSADHSSRTRAGAIEVQLLEANKAELHLFIGRCEEDKKATGQRQQNRTGWAGNGIRDTLDSDARIRARIHALAEIQREAALLASSKASITSGLQKLWATLPSMD